MEFANIRVADGLDFQDISEERQRTYHFPNGTPFTVQDPIALHVSDSGGHRLILKDGSSVYIRPTWIAFEFGPVEALRLHWRF